MNRGPINSWFNLSVVTALLFATITTAHAFELFAGSPMIPGNAELEAGNLDEAIAKFSKQAQSHHREIKSSAFTGLCAAYILKDNLEMADEYCERAADFGQRAAFNNRGVLSTKRGDWASARDDFVRAKRPPGRNSLNLTEVRYLASRNLGRVNDHAGQEAVVASK